MRLGGRRNSDNVEDRRGMSGTSLGIGGGIIGVIVFAVATLFSGGDIGDVVSGLVSGGEYGEDSEYVETEEDAYLADLTSKVLAGTEDVWTREFERQGWGEYECPKLVLYHGAVSSGCGNATSQVGPFYCSVDETVYIDLDFFKTMEEEIGGGGDFAYAYVIAHEVGHHVQHLLGIMEEADSKMENLSETEANKISVRLELQADFLAGVWAYQDNEMFNSIEDGDIEEAIDVAGKIGDDYLQQQAYGQEMPDSFNHGRSSQRIRWLKRGLTTGDVSQGDTFSIPYSQL
ncbi:MAG: neutral zinc metallopeptidase [Muribaculaceae bacterium]|nr:neutral zinc metallopeptidase [Muribaculaceae bacterium]